MGSRKREPYQFSTRTTGAIKVTTVFIIAALFFVAYNIGQFYELIWGPGTDKSNWILFAYKPMLVKWNVKYLSEEVNRVIEAVAFLLAVKYLSKRQDNEAGKIISMAVIYLWYRCLDIGYYFINFKTEYYNTIWVLLAIIELYLVRRSKKKDYIAQ